MGLNLCRKVACLGLTAIAYAWSPSSASAAERPRVELKLPYSDFIPYENQLTRAEVEARISRFLVKSPDSDLKNYYSLSDRALSIYESPWKKKRDEPEFVLLLNTGSAAETPVSSALGDWRPQKNPSKPLQGLRVALDPGHLGGEIAGPRKPEDRYVWMRDSGVQFNEGTLAFLTARILRTLLVEKGAEVLITRDAIGEGAEGIPYSFWLNSYFKEDLEEWLQNVFTNDADRERARAAATDPNTPSGPMKVLSWRDFRLRAQKINAFDPHLTLVMHFNAGAPAKDTQGRDIGVDENLLMAFVPGSFTNGELSDQPSRYHFVRLIVTDAVRESQAFSRVVLEELSQTLRVNITPPDYPASYLVNSSIFLETGVYARNLGMNRLTHGRICYAEPLFQDNFDESLRLARTDVTIDGVATSSRLLEVAAGYYRAILEMASRAGDKPYLAESR